MNQISCSALKAQIGAYTFIIYAVLLVFYFVYTLFKLPETKGKEPEEVLRSWEKTIKRVATKRTAVVSWIESKAPQLCATVFPVCRVFAAGRSLTLFWIWLTLDLCFCWFLIKWQWTKVPGNQASLWYVIIILPPLFCPHLVASFLHWLLS